MQHTIDDYKATAQGAFSSLLPTIAKYAKNGWRVGNALDTVFDYVFYFPPKEPPAVAELALERWKSDDIQKTMCWYDDYAWWGIASAKAFDDRYAPVFDSHRDEFQALALHCWTLMDSGRPNNIYKYKGAPNVWDNRDERPDTGYFRKHDSWAVPRYLGGVWQGEMFKTARPKETECSPSNPADPNTCAPPLGPFQLTLMQSLYMVLALRLQASGNGTAKAAEPVRGFLQNWITGPADPELQLVWLLRPNDPTKVLVRERVSTYADRGSGDFRGVQGYEKWEAWTGDQGLMIGALLDYLQFHWSDQDALSLSLKIMSGVFSGLTRDKVVVPGTSGLLSRDQDDYDCGSGVFWRYLLYGFEQTALFRNEVLKLVTADPNNNPIVKSADDACNGNSPGDELFKDFNTLATLTTAIKVLEVAGS